MAADERYCVIWPFAVRKSSGYPALSLRANGKQTHHDAHRDVCEKANGKPADGEQAAHKCGNKLCVKGSHLYWASAKQNMEDAKAHGTLKGGGRYRQRISMEDIGEIVASDRSHLQLAMKYGTDASYIGRLRRKYTMKIGDFVDVPGVGVRALEAASR